MQMKVTNSSISTFGWRSWFKEEEKRRNVERMKSRRLNKFAALQWSITSDVIVGWRSAGNWRPAGDTRATFSGPKKGPPGPFEYFLSCQVGWRQPWPTDNAFVPTTQWTEGVFSPEVCVPGVSPRWPFFMKNWKMTGKFHLFRVWSLCSRPKTFNVFEIM